MTQAREKNAMLDWWWGKEKVGKHATDVLKEKLRRFIIECIGSCIYKLQCIYLGFKIVYNWLNVDIVFLCFWEGNLFLKRNKWSKGKSFIKCVY